MKTTKVYSKIVEAYNSGYNHIINRGGTWSGKTYAELQFLFSIFHLNEEVDGKSIDATVVSESLPHLKTGAIKDFENILKEENRFNDSDINYTDHIYHFGRSAIQFLGVDKIGKATGPKRDFLLLNECNNIPFPTAWELIGRTRELVMYDFNPVKQFWIEENILTLPSKDIFEIKSNYLDNQFVPDPIRKLIEHRCNTDPNYKRIHIDCEYGVYEGLIFPDITLIDQMPPGKPDYGLDYGFTNDPTVLSANLIIGDNLYIDELFYLTGMTTPDIINALKSHGIKREEITGDSADPRMNEELRRAGFNVFPAIKGPGSIQHGIDAMKRYKIHVTKRSVNGIKEFRNYSFKIDSSGKATNEPIDYFNHFIDSVRYPVARKTSQPKQKAPVYKTYRR